MDFEQMIKNTDDMSDRELLTYIAYFQANTFMAMSDILAQLVSGEISKEKFDEKIQLFRDVVLRWTAEDCEELKPKL